MRRGIRHRLATTNQIEWGNGKKCKTYQKKANQNGGSWEVGDRAIQSKEARDTMRSTTFSKIFIVSQIILASCFWGADADTTPPADGPLLALLAISPGGAAAAVDSQIDVAGGVTLPAAVGSPVTVDASGDGKADGLDYSGNGSPDAQLIDTDGNGTPDAVDTDGDGNADAYIGNCSGAPKLTTGANCSGETIRVIPGVGFDRDGDGTADDTFIQDAAADSTPPTMGANVAGGTYPTEQAVTFTCADDRAPGAIVYTLDGSTPAFGSPPTGTVVHPPSFALSIGATTTVRALCRDLGGNVSAILTSTYTITDAVAPVVSFDSPAAGTYPTGQTFAMSCSDVGTGCRTLAYTTDGSDPTFGGGGSITNGFAYSAPVAIPPGSTQVKIRAEDFEDNVSAVVSRSFFIGPPAAPAGVVASAGNGQVEVSWNSVAGATTYTLYYSTSSPVTTGATSVSGIAGTSRTVTGLTNGVTYYFRVTATHAGGTSGLSSEVSAAPIDALIIFVTSSTFDGRMAPGGNLADLDALCNTDPSKPNASNYSAHTLDGRGLLDSRTYRRPDGTIIGATGTGLPRRLSDPLTNPISASAIDAWTSDMGGGDDCNDWRTNAAGQFPHAGSVGDTSQTTRAGGWVNARIVDCSDSYPLICIEQP